MGIVRPCYKVIVPKREANFKVQWEDCFGELCGFILNSEYKPFRICVFIHTTDEADDRFKSGLIRKSFLDLDHAGVLPYSIIPQSPEEPFDIVVELGMVCETDARVEYHSAEGVNYCTITTADGLQECWMVGAMSPGINSNRFAVADGTFKLLKSVLDCAGLNFGTIVRQWNYVGGILESGLVDGCLMQHYQIFNEVRNRYYTQYRQSPYFPAATGIGMNSVQVGIDCFAIREHVDLKVIAISNPNQEESYQYGQEVLVGDSGGRKQPPQFERALLLKLGTTVRLIVSGTASIVGQKTFGIGDVELQTKVTINNIEMLASSANLRNHCPDLHEYPDKYSYLRVYIKNRSDIDVVKKICIGHFGKIPITFVQADICRGDLLVEIEAEKISV